MSTIVAVALGLAAEPSDRSAAFTAGPYSTQVGNFSQFTDRRGTTFLKGRNRHGIPYNLVMDKYGYVDGEVGDYHVNFRIREVS